MSTTPVPVPFRLAIPDSQLQRLRRKIEDYELPEKEIVPNAGWGYGVELDWVKSLKRAWLEEYDWRKVEAEINRYFLPAPNLPPYLTSRPYSWSNYKVEIEGVNLHFVHQRSSRPDAVPLLLVHGWPGSFYEFHNIIEPLTNPPEGQPAFHVIIPSVPGFGFSSTPQKQGWNVTDTARILNTLATEVLGYEAYAVQGGDWVGVLVRVCCSATSHTFLHPGFNHFGPHVRLPTLQGCSSEYVCCPAALLPCPGRPAICHAQVVVKQDSIVDVHRGGTSPTGSVQDLCLPSRIRKHAVYAGG